MTFGYFKYIPLLILLTSFVGFILSKSENLVKRFKYDANVSENRKCSIIIWKFALTVTVLAMR